MAAKKGAKKTAKKK